MQDMQDMQETGRFEADRHSRSLLRHGRGSRRVLEEHGGAVLCMHARARTHGRAGGTPLLMGPDCPGVMSDRGNQRADRLGTLRRGKTTGRLAGRLD